MLYYDLTPPPPTNNPHLPFTGFQKSTFIVTTIKSLASAPLMVCVDRPHKQQTHSPVKRHIDRGVAILNHTYNKLIV